MRARLAIGLLFSVSVAGACGGRLVHSVGDDSGGGNASDGGTSQRGGRSGVGGSVGGNLATGGAASGGRFPSAGSPSSGGGCACPIIACPPGYVALPNADGCCFHCESACSNVLCPGSACASGSHLELLPGQCCPTCVQDSCEMQRAGYQALRQELVEKYSGLSCTSNSDCVVYYEKNQCNVGCGIVLHSSAIPYLDSNLQSYAQSSCSANCMSPVPPCDAPAAPVCFRGLCE